jgi:hypothetical protein
VPGITRTTTSLILATRISPRARQVLHYLQESPAGE